MGNNVSKGATKVDNKNFGNGQPKFLKGATHEQYVLYCFMNINKILDLRHVDFIDGGQHGVGVLCLLQSFRNLQSHSAHLNSLFGPGACYLFGGVLRGQFNGGSFDGLGMTDGGDWDGGHGGRGLGGSGRWRPGCWRSGRCWRWCWRCFGSCRLKNNM